MHDWPHLPRVGRAGTPRSAVRWRRVALAGVLTIGAIWWRIELTDNLYWVSANLSNDFWTYRQAGLNVLQGHAL